MRHSLLRLLLLTAAVLPASSCTFYSVATHWNGRLGPDGEPVYFATASKVGFNLLILVPFLGHTTVDAMVDEITEEIARREGDIVRIVQGTTENYWYGWSPLTWIITPVVATISVEYQPTQEELEKDRREQAEEEGDAEPAPDANAG